MIREAYIIIHHALHSDQSVVTIGGKDYPILKAPNGCRYVTYDGIKIMQQNKNKSSTYAERARNGEKITWVMEQPKWLCIDDAVIQSLSQPKTTDNVPKQQFQPGSSTRVQKFDNKPGNRRNPRNFWRSPQ